MPAPKSATASKAGKAGVKPKTASSSGTATPVSSAEKDTSDITVATLTGGRPDKKAYDTQQEQIKKEIDALQVKLVRILLAVIIRRAVSAVREKISLATGHAGPGNDRRQRSSGKELDDIRSPSSPKASSREARRLEQVKALQDSVQQKVKALQAAKGKVPFKTVEEVDAHIKNLEKQVESGSMKLADEKRALNEIQTTRRSRKIVESFQADQASIEADRAQIDELKKQLDDPVAKAASERWETIQKELDDLKKQGDEAAAGRNKLFKERDDIQAKLNALYDQKRSSANAFREANDRYYKKIQEERQRRAERERAQRLAEEQAKKKEIADRLLEEAQIPAFQFQIEDCQTLIDSLSGKTTGNVTFKSTPDSQAKSLTGVPKLEVRKVEASVPEGAVIKKKGGDEESYFVANKRNKGGNKKPSSKPAPEAPASPATPSSTSQLQLPLPTLSALLSLSIPPPASSADIPRVIEDLKTKKAWFEANQDRVTAENIVKAKARIEKLSASDGEAQGPVADAASADIADAASPQEARIDA
ncbi:hypothetical protein NMY22_g14069 [Coprinellus aureogranulatus]|nr:hypothetical protein NMY22_g14069 [Coprinellus aureogranulatus]